MPEWMIGYKLKDECQFFSLLQAVVGVAVLVFFPGFIKGLGKAVSVVEHLGLLARHGGLTHGLINKERMSEPRFERKRSV